MQRYAGLGFFGNVGFISFPRCVSLMLAAACVLIITQEMLVLPSYSISTTVVRRKAAAMLLWFVYSCALLQENVTPFAVSTCQASRFFVLGPYRVSFTPLASALFWKLSLLNDARSFHVCS